MSVLLNGKNEYNIHNLTGKNINSSVSNHEKIKNIKERMISDYIIPFFSKQWSILRENMYLVDNIIYKLTYYYSIYKEEEFSIYINLLKILKSLVEKQILLDDNDKTQFTKQQNDIISMVYKTVMIKLLPEYEIYNNIFGKPKKELKQKYNEIIIQDIKSQMNKENITYSGLKLYIINKYSSSML
jgi:hypothetical protein